MKILRNTRWSGWKKINRLNNRSFNTSNILKLWLWALLFSVLVVQIYLSARNLVDAQLKMLCSNQSGWITSRYFAIFNSNNIDIDQCNPLVDIDWDSDYWTFRVDIFKFGQWWHLVNIMLNYHSFNFITILHYPGMY